mmetsp:Transcript_8093/g.25733  ORF Transcript_8093/g.25733 Transcript_8093/m.25733 type:complete len:384 (-) Transcript_8093:91-1242(-)
MAIGRLPPSPQGSLGFFLILGLSCWRCGGLRVEPGRPTPPPHPREAPQPQAQAGGLVTPEGPKVKPAGRHIQLLYVSPPHGLTDRLKFYIRPLAALGRYHNATVHMSGGRAGPALWLQRVHTVDLPGSWARYFNVEANGGNPFHEIKNFKGCKTFRPSIATQKDAWEKLFDMGHACVNIVDDLPRDLIRHRIVAESDVEIPVSYLVQDAARTFISRYNLSEAYGSVHIRRCDMIESNRACTAPEAIYVQVAKHDVYSTWLVFLYAEPGYRERLQKRLAPLGRRFLFEDEVALNERYPGDNYFTYLVGKYLHGAAGSIVETHHCGFSSRPHVLPREGSLRGIYLTQLEEEVVRQADGELLESAYEEGLAATCADGPHGTLLQSA